jgi:hypothetical protein
MVGPPIDPSAARYVRMMTDHRRELVRQWPLVLVAFGVAIAIGVASPDRSEPHPDGAPSAATKAK